MNVLYVENLVKHYRGKRVVNGVSLFLQSGDVVGLLGPNGAGKTTCFYMVLGLVPPDQGSIMLDETDLSRQPIYRRAQAGLSYLPQESSIFRRMTVAENILAILEVKGFGKAECLRRLHALLDELGIAHLASQQAISLSGGERRRVEIARALAADPKFLLLDEPFAGIDPLAVHDIKASVALLAARGIGVLITDHNVRETLAICSRAYIISMGKVIASGRPEEIVYNEEVRRVYLGEEFQM
jgi:lipopolysaccharide export system ATP-binding protein